MRIRLTSWLGAVALTMVLPLTSSAQTASPAESALLARISARPADASAYLDLAKLYSELRRFDDALSMLQRATSVIQQQRVAGGTRALVGGNSGVTPVQIGAVMAQPSLPPAATASVMQAVRVGGDIPEPKKIKDVRPVYPQIAQTAGVQGIVIIEAVIATDGTVTQARVLRGQALLDQAAIDAVRQWRYTTTMLNGAPVEVIMTVTVNFTLGASSSSSIESLGAPASGTLRVGGEIAEPRKIKDVKPIYPQEALDANVQGIVILEITINEQGKVSDAKLLRARGNGLLDQAAVDAVAQWEYTPTLVNGVPTPVRMTVTVNFTKG
jgi:TonB family protein